MTYETRETLTVLENVVSSYLQFPGANTVSIQLGRKEAAALRDVLTPRTCSTCRHIRDGEPQDGWVWCHEKSENWRSDDGCIRGWQAREGEGGVR